MNQTRTVASRVGRILLLTSLLCIVLSLAVWTAGPALMFAVFSAVLVLSPLVWFPRAPVAALVTARRRRTPARAPPVF